MQKVQVPSWAYPQIRPRPLQKMFQRVLIDNRIHQDQMMDDTLYYLIKTPSIE